MKETDISYASETAVTIVEKADITVVDDLPLLDEREALWLHHYLNDRPLFNATGAAVKMGYVHESAMTMGYRIKHRPEVQAHIRAFIADLGMTKERIVANLAAIANSDWADHVQVKMNRIGVVVDARMDLTSVVKANELLGRELGMFTEKVDMSVEVVAKRLEISQAEYDAL